MNRESIYFSHDADAMNDPKCMLLVAQLGMEGYGTFWALVEMLRTQPEYRLPLSLIPAISTRLNITQAKLETVIRSFGLFDLSEDSFFFSQSLRVRMELMEEKSRRRRLAGRKAGLESGKARKMKALQASNERTFNECSTNDERTMNENEQKEKKIVTHVTIIQKKEIHKEKAIAFVPPTVGDVFAYCQERKNNVDAENFVDFYTAKNWMVGKNKMKDWKAAVRTWEKSTKTTNHEVKDTTDW